MLADRLPPLSRITKEHSLSQDSCRKRIEARRRLPDDWVHKGGMPLVTTEPPRLRGTGQRSRGKPATYRLDHRRETSHLDDDPKSSAYGSTLNPTKTSLHSAFAGYRAQSGGMVCGVTGMWKPEKLGEVVAERTFVARNGSKRSVRIVVRFGRPVRGKGVPRHDPWWCPVEIKGAGLDSFRPIAGVDSLQALVLALDQVTVILPQGAARKGLRIDWLGDTERLVLARHALGRGTEGAMMALFGLLRDVAAILSADGDSERRTTAALRAIVKSMRTDAPRQARKRARSPRSS
jgi:hypothetical protein